MAAAAASRSRSDTPRRNARPEPAPAPRTRANTPRLNLRPSVTPTPRGGLIEIADRAISKYSNHADRVAYVTKNVKNDPALLWELMTKVRQTLIVELLRGRIQAKNPKPAKTPVYHPVYSSLRSTPTTPDRTAAARPAMMSMLDKFTINGRAIGDATVAEAKGWSLARKADVLFVDLLTAGLQDNDVIRKKHTAKEAEAFWLRAQTERKAA